MSKTVLNIKTDREVKKEAAKVAGEIGVPLSTVVNAFLKEFVRERKVILSADLAPRPGIISILKKASADYRERKNTSPVISSSKKLPVFLRRS